LRDARPRLCTHNLGVPILPGNMGDPGSPKLNFYNTGSAVSNATTLV